MQAAVVSTTQRIYTSWGVLLGLVSVLMCPSDSGHPRRVGMLIYGVLLQRWTVVCSGVQAARRSSAQHERSTEPGSPVSHQDKALNILPKQLLLTQSTCCSHRCGLAFTVPARESEPGEHWEALGEMSSSHQIFETRDVAVHQQVQGWGSEQEISSPCPCARGQNVMEFPMLQVRRNFSVLEDREAWEQMAWGSGGISAAGNHCRGRERQVCQKWHRYNGASLLARQRVRSPLNSLSWLAHSVCATANQREQKCCDLHALVLPEAENKNAEQFLMDTKRMKS